MKSDIVWVLPPKYGHVIPAINFIKAVQAHFGSIDVYTDTEVGGRLTEEFSCDGLYYVKSWKNDFEALREKPFIQIFPELLSTQGTMLRELETLWTGAYRPKLIIADCLVLSACGYARKYQIPLVRVYPTYILNNREVQKELTKDYLRRAFVQLTLFSDLFFYLKSKIAYKKNLPTNEIGRLKSDMDIAFLPSFLAAKNSTATEHHVGPSFRKNGIAAFNGLDVSRIARRNKLVYIAIGTLKVSIKFFENCLEAFEGTEHAVVIVCRPPYDKEIRRLIPTNCYLVDFVSQMDILKITDVFITHCGMNSFLEGIYNRVPMIAWPLDSDGWITAARMEQMGVGKQLSSDKPSDIYSLAVDVMHDETIKENLETYSRILEAEATVAESTFIELISQLYHACPS